MLRALGSHGGCEIAVEREEGAAGGDWLGNVSPRRGGPRRSLLGAEGNQDSGQGGPEEPWGGGGGGSWPECWVNGRVSSEVGAQEEEQVGGFGVWGRRHRIGFQPWPRPLPTTAPMPSPGCWVHPRGFPDRALL